MVLVNSKQAAHAAASSVAALQAKNPMDPADSQVKSAVAASEGLVWDEATAAAFETIREVITYELAKYDLCEYAEDVYQDTYLAAFHTPSRVGPSRGELGDWFRGIARYIARMCVRRVLRNDSRVQSLDEGLEHGLDFVDDQDCTNNSLETEHILRALSLAVGHHVAFERALVLAFRYDGDTGAAAEFLGIPRRTVQWSQQMVRKFGVVIARALTVRAAREEYGKAHEPVTVGELLWCLPQEVDAAGYVQLLGQVGSVKKVSKADVMAVTGLSRPEAGRYVSEVVRMLSIARSVVETGTLAIAEEEA
ncbi:sigma-70 family RNA polymerase sigma factor [Rothia dentocariosa]|uniref:RNA polymerase sigma factor n=1 Tax=Rothia dentocariosa TaxID=2047 RepID=UPI0014557FFF|nr:sigma-70 family RNA polymerase sigma factor [Rothia dentocariosa]NLR25037.1 sigma-70 family RNA polymerase sigma factor [Rothia dentocariosa]